MKIAVLIGINYITAIPEYILKDSINNMMIMKQLLISHYGYVESNIFMLKDDDEERLPTRAFILTALNDLAIASKSVISYSEVCIYYCGHGSHIQGMNEGNPKVEGIIVPVDYKTEGFIEDDVIFKYVSYIKCPVLLIIDTTHSGNMCDLEFGLTHENQKIMKNTNIIMFSGSNENETSLNMGDTSKCDDYDSVFTNSLLQALKSNGYYKTQIGKVNQNIYEWLKQYGKSDKSSLEIVKSDKSSPEVVKSTSVRKRSFRRFPLPSTDERIYSVDSIHHNPITYVNMGYSSWKLKQPKMNMIYYL